MSERRTRGPRTPAERASDAARSAATLLEKAPPTHHTDDFLRPIAALIRLFESTVGSVDMEAVGVEYDKLRRYCGWLETDIETRRMRKIEAEVRQYRAELEPLVQEARAFLASKDPDPRPTLRLVGDDA